MLRISTVLGLTIGAGMVAAAVMALVWPNRFDVGVAILIGLGAYVIAEKVGDMLGAGRPAPAAAVPPGSTPAPGGPRCPRCGGPSAFNAQFGRFCCVADGQYV
jgi:hypothetical protein